MACEARQFTCFDRSHLHVAMVRIARYAYACRSRRWLDKLVMHVEYFRALAVMVGVLGLPLLSGCVPLAVGTAVGGGAVAAQDRRTVGQLVEDEAIELKTISAIAGDEELSGSAHINVTSFNGHVLLSGEVADERGRARAESLAEGVNKVAWVFNELHVGEPSSLVSRGKDTAITTTVKSSMIIDNELRATHVKVVTERGIVYLMGLVTRAEGVLAAEHARTASGVVRVVKLFQYID